MSDLSNFDFRPEPRRQYTAPVDPVLNRPRFDRAGAGELADTMPAGKSVATRPVVLLAVGVVVALAAVVAGGVVISRGADSSVTVAGSSQADAASRPAVVEEHTWNGMVLPVSGTAGPQQTRAGRAAGFERTELGAALAAANLSVRVDPTTGPSVFAATIRTQMDGDTAAVLSSVSGHYKAMAKITGITGGKPIPARHGDITGWRISAYDASNPVTVDLRVTLPDGTGRNFAVSVVWNDQAQDWHLVAPTTQVAFPISPTSGTYESFTKE